MPCHHCYCYHHHHDCSGPTRGDVTSTDSYFWVRLSPLLSFWMRSCLVSSWKTRYYSYYCYSYSEFGKWVP